MMFQVQVGQHNFEVDIKKTNDYYSVRIGDTYHSVDLIKDPSGILYSCIIDGNHYEALCTDQGDLISVEFQEKCYDLVVSQAERGRGSAIKPHAAIGHQMITAPMPGLVKVIKVAPGDSVKAGDAVLILEAMKMQNELRSPVSATIAEVLVKAGKAVEKGEKLIALEV